MNTLLMLIYTIIGLIFINTGFSLIFSYLNISYDKYGSFIAWINGLAIFITLLPKSSGDAFK